MSSISERVAREHRAVGIVGACVCGARAGVDISADHHRTRHIIAVTEALTRAQVAAEIEDLEHTREQVAQRIRDGYTAEWVGGYDTAARRAAYLAEGGERE